MSSKDPKKPQLKGVFHLNINTSNHQNNQDLPKDEPKLSKPGDNLPQQSEGNILTTMNSLHPLNQNDPLDTSNMTNIFPVPKPYKVYSYSKDYYDELYLNLIFDEQRFYQKINYNYMNFQKNINSNMRAILIDWLIDVHYRFNMKRKTLFHCVFIIDAYLSKNTVERTKLQLLGMVALLIACKQNEIIYPRLTSFLAVADNAYTLKELTDMELKVIKKLEFDILAPTAEEFFSINADYFEFTQKQRFFGEYLLDVSLLDFGLLKYKPSTIAVACGYIVMKFFHLNGINLIIDNASPDVNQNNVKECAKHLCFLMKFISQSVLGATKNKYMSDKYMKVAQICEDSLDI